MRLIFAGTPEFAATSLAALVTSPHAIACVYTQPDRPAGRGRKLTPSPVKQLALKHGLALRQPARLKHPDAWTELRSFGADLMIVVAYGLILPQQVLDIPARGCINVHASLLPRWRGAAPIQRCILAGDASTGVSIMQMDAGLDTGPVLATASTSIGPAATGGTLHDRLAEMGARLLLETLAQIQQGRAEAVPQDDRHATYATKLSKEEAWLDWHRSAIELERQVRAFNPWPVAQTRLQGAAVRVWEAAPQPQTGAPGVVLQADKGGIMVGTGDGSLLITRLQLPGKRPLSAADFLNARMIEPGTVYDR